MKVEWTTSELKETILILLAVLWGIILLLPGNTFAEPSRVDILSTYAADHVWGTLLVLICSPLPSVNRYRHTRYRSFVHAFLWVFWLGISALVIYRSSTNGVAYTDYLITLPFVALALMHGVIYVGLGRKVIDDQSESA